MAFYFKNNFVYEIIINFMFTEKRHSGIYNFLTYLLRFAYKGKGVLALWRSYFFILYLQQ